MHQVVIQILQAIRGWELTPWGCQRLNKHRDRWLGAGIAHAQLRAPCQGCNLIVADAVATGMGSSCTTISAMLVEACLGSAVSCDHVMSPLLGFSLLQLQALAKLPGLLFCSCHLVRPSQGTSLSGAAWCKH